MTRRTLLVSLALAPFRHPIGLNLFTVRGPLAKDPAGTYKALAAMGVSTLEVRPIQLTQHGAMTRDNGLRPVHMFVETPVITGAWEEWEFSAGMAAKFKMPAPPANAPRPTLAEMITLAKQHGVQRIGTSMLLAGERSTAIDAFNKAVNECSAAGVELYYHNHAFEFSGSRGATFFDQLRQRLDKRIRFELDIFWASITSNDPAALIGQLKGRVRSIHLKDLAPNAEFGGNEMAVPPTAFRELGKGNIDLPKVLRAAQKAGVEHYLLELDHSPGDPLESVRNSIQYLKQVQL